MKALSYIKHTNHTTPHTQHYTLRLDNLISTNVNQLLTQYINTLSCSYTYIYITT